MFSRSPVSLRGLVKKVVTCWERHLRLCTLLFLAKVTSNEMDLKEERLQNTWKSQGNLCPCFPGGAYALATFEELHLWDSDCLPLCLSSWAFSSSPLSIFVSQRMWAAPCRALPWTFFCPSNGEEHSLKRLCPRLPQRQRSYGRKKKKERTINCSLCASKSKPTQHNLPSALGHFPWVCPNLRFGGKPTSTACLVAQDPE